MHRFYVQEEDIAKDTIVLKASQAKHAFLVLRLKAQDEVVVFDGKGKEYLTVVASISRGQGLLDIKKSQYLPEDKIKITLAAAIPKHSKFGDIVDRATQLGVNRIIPVITQRTIVKIPKAKAKAKQTRWQKIAQEAAAQCSRVYAPEVEVIRDFKDVVKDAARYKLALIGSLDKDNVPLKKILKSHKQDQVIVFIGPEGDFSDQEMKLAKNKGCLAISLGGNVLRCETAVNAILAILNYEWRD